MEAMRWAVVLLWSAGVVWAQDRASFGVGLSDVRTHLLKGRGARAEKDLRALLDTHRERDYVVAQRADVADLMRRCVLRRQFPQPKPKDLVSGKLLFHTLETGRVRLKYKPAVEKAFEGFDRAKFEAAFERYVDEMVRRDRTSTR